MNKNNLMILCKVVDNFGDIGVLYRLAKALCDIKNEVNIYLVVSNLESFKFMAREIDCEKDIQNFHYNNSTWTVIKWDLKNYSVSNNNIISFSDSPLKIDVNTFPVIIEGFQCGRPDWLENIIFGESFTQSLQILNLDYLTAEEYADEFHLLRSGTRKTNIKKRFFMPGFTEKTGGLILNSEGGSLPLAPKQSFSATLSEDTFKIAFFAYERKCHPIIKAIKTFQDEKKLTDPEFTVRVYVAAGKSHDPFMDAWKQENQPFCVTELPFLQQQEWDELLTKMNFNFIRGEDSLSRAALSGIPYVWHAYIQDEDYQLVKVDALLDRMEEYFNPEEFRILKDYWNSYNTSTRENFTAVLTDGPGIVAETPQRSEELQQKPGGEAEVPWKLLKELLVMSSDNKKMLNQSFRNFSRKLISNGNLAQHLLDYISTLEI